MSTEVTNSKPVAVDFTIDGKPIFVRKMPLRLGLKMQSAFSDGELPADVVAEAIQQCAVREDGTKVFDSPDTVLDMDTTVMLKLFSEVSTLSFTVEDAGKN